MAPTTRPITIDNLPTDLVAAVAAEAERDAIRVAQFLGHLSLQGTPDKPLSLPRGFLRSLGAALRLLSWEVQGFSFHRDAGLASAAEALGESFASLYDPDADTAAFCRAGLRLSVERLAWAGAPELGIDVAVDDADEDMVLEALADFLWAHRPH
jgi:hypothetical protein